MLDRPMNKEERELLSESLAEEKDLNENYECIESAELSESEGMADEMD